MKKIWILGLLFLCVNGCSSKKENTLICTLDINKYQDQVILTTKDDETISKEVEKIDMKFTEDQQAQMNRIVNENVALFSFKGATYTYQLDKTSLTSTLTLDYEIIPIDLLQDKLSIVAQSYHQKKQAIMLKDRVESLYSLGYSCE